MYSSWFLRCTDKSFAAANGPRSLIRLPHAKVFKIAALQWAGVWKDGAQELHDAIHRDQEHHPSRLQRGLPSSRVDPVTKWVLCGEWSPLNFGSWTAGGLPTSRCIRLHCGLART